MWVNSPKAPSLSATIISHWTKNSRSSLNSMTFTSERGHTAQSFSRIKTRHILRRQKRTRTETDPDGDSKTYAFALVDFQDAMALEEMDERRRDFVIACDDATLKRQRGRPKKPE
ncbi:hypothetical protein IAT40_007813 [Kwoniella sp. CBS 6097]